MKAKPIPKYQVGEHVFVASDPDIHLRVSGPGRVTKVALGGVAYYKNDGPWYQVQITNDPSNAGDIPEGGWFVYESLLSEGGTELTWVTQNTT